MLVAAAALLANASNIPADSAIGPVLAEIGASSDFHFEFLDATKGYTRIDPKHQWPFGQPNEVVLASTSSDVRNFLPITFIAELDGKTMFKATARDALSNCRGATGCSVPGPVLGKPANRTFLLEARGGGKVLATFALSPPGAGGSGAEEPAEQPPPGVPSGESGETSPPTGPPEVVTEDGGHSWPWWLGWSLLLLFVVAAATGMLLATSRGIKVLEWLYRNRIRDLQERIDIQFDRGRTGPAASEDPCKRLEDECTRLREAAARAKAEEEQAEKEFHKASGDSDASNRKMSEAVQAAGEADKAADKAGRDEHGTAIPTDEAREEMAEGRRRAKDARDQAERLAGEAAAGTTEWQEKSEEWEQARDARRAADEAARRACQEAEKCKKEATEAEEAAGRAAAEAEQEELRRRGAESRESQGSEPHGGGDCCPNGLWIGSGVHTGGICGFIGYESLVVRLVCASDRSKWVEVDARRVRWGIGFGGECEAVGLVVQGGNHPGDAAEQALMLISGYDGDISLSLSLSGKAKLLKNLEALLEHVGERAVVGLTRSLLKDAVDDSGSGEPLPDDFMFGAGVGLQVGVWGGAAFEYERHESACCTCH